MFVLSSRVFFYKYKNSKPSVWGELAVRRVCCLLQTLVRGRITLAQRRGVILYTRVYEKSLRPMFTDRAWMIRIDCPSLSLFYRFSINKQTEQQETADVCVCIRYAFMYTQRILFYMYTFTYSSVLCHKPCVRIHASTSQRIYMFHVL